MGTSVGHYKKKRKKGCGCWCRPLQGKKLSWAPPLDLKKREPLIRNKMGLKLNSSPTFSFFLLLVFSLLQAVLFCFTLLFFSCCCSFFRSIVLLIVLLVSSSRCLAFLFALMLFFGCSFILGTRLFMLLFSFSRYFALLILLLLLVCFYSLKNLILPLCIFSCKNWEWSGVKNQKPIFFQ